MEIFSLIAFLAVIVIPLVLVVFLDWFDKDKKRRQGSILLSLAGMLVFGTFNFASSQNAAARSSEERAELGRSVSDVSKQGTQILGNSEKANAQLGEARLTIENSEGQILKLRSENSRLSSQNSSLHDRVVALQLQVASLSSEQGSNAEESRIARVQLEKDLKAKADADLHAQRVAHCRATFEVRMEKQGFGNAIQPTPRYIQHPTNKKLLGEGQCLDGAYLTPDHPDFGKRNYGY